MVEKEGNSSALSKTPQEKEKIVILIGSKGIEYAADVSFPCNTNGSPIAPGKILRETGEIPGAFRKYVVDNPFQDTPEKKESREKHN